MGFKTNRPQAHKDFGWGLHNILKVHAEMAGVTEPGLQEPGPALALVIAEREKQVFEDGRSAPFDEVNNPDAQLVNAAQCHILAAKGCAANEIGNYPWDNLAAVVQRPHSRLLLQAAALLVAEVDRLLYNGEAYSCDRCGLLNDSPPPAVPDEQKRKGEFVICTSCWEIQKAADAKAPVSN